MSAFILWYLSISLLGLLAFPLSYRFLPALPDRGYALSRALGLLLWGYLFWLLSYLGVLVNDVGGLLFALLLLAGLGLWALRTVGRNELWAWLRRQRAVVLSVEALFVLAFAAWAIVRSTYPEITFTEKPMELAFINAVVNSPQMPPFDPWLSGFAISYYYFGYVLVGMLANLTAIPAGVAFNLGLALIFALTALGAYGLLYNLLALRREEAKGQNAFLALLAPFFVLLLSNAEGFLEILHARGIFWTRGANGELISPFWSWLDIKDLNLPPVEIRLDWLPRTFGSGNWWWWRASRVINDLTFTGAEQELIDEFPFFAYLLGDLHPHVLVMPFSFLAMALALNLFRGGSDGTLRIWEWRYQLSRSAFFLAAFVFGGLAFLNIWDFPTAVVLFAGAYFLREVQLNGWARVRLSEFLVLGAALVVTGIALYLPYYIGFSSQAAGVLPNLLNPTRGAHLWVFWGLLLLPMFAYLVYQWRQRGGLRRLRQGMLLGLGIVLGLWVISILLTLIIAFGLSFLGNLVPAWQGLSEALLADIGAPDLRALLAESFARRLSGAGGWITLVIFLGLIIAVLWPRAREAEAAGVQAAPPSSSQSFVLLLMLLGALLVVGPEFLYLRDFFGTRMNTVFKLYFQTWMLWGLAASFGVAVMLSELRRSWAWLYRGALFLLFVVGLTYTVYGLWDKSSGFRPQNGYSLDGTQHFAYFTADDKAAIDWLTQAPRGVVAEAVGGSYSPLGHARVATHSGKATVLGWDFHQTQWGRPGDIVNARRTDIERLYATPNWQEAERILQQYEIRYVYLGPLERSSYAVNDGKFQRFLRPVFQQGEVTIYEYVEALQEARLP